MNNNLNLHQLPLICFWNSINAVVIAFGAAALIVSIAVVVVIGTFVFMVSVALVDVMYLNIVPPSLSM